MSLMRRLTLTTLISCLAVAGAAFTAGPAAAHPSRVTSENVLECTTGAVCLYPLEDFAGTPVALSPAAESHACAPLRIKVRSAINLSPYPVRLFARADCTGNHVHLKVKAKLGKLKIAAHSLVFLP